jgi:hypothetical protein
MYFLLNVHIGEMWRYVWKYSVRIFEKNGNALELLKQIVSVNSRKEFGK